MEILRHHRTEKHLRRDQRWRYEHLRSVDPVTNMLQHRVRGRNGKLLTKIELARELPKFIHAELVDTGERFPFTEGRTTALVTPESRAKTQLRIVGDFIQRQGDFSVLRSLWSSISSLTDHQASLCDFDWGDERMTVITNLYLALLFPNKSSAQCICFVFRLISSISSIVLYVRSRSTLPPNRTLPLWALWDIFPNFFLSKGSPFSISLIFHNRLGV